MQEGHDVAAMASMGACWQCIRCDCRFDSAARGAFSGGRTGAGSPLPARSAGWPGALASASTCGLSCSASSQPPVNPARSKPARMYGSRRMTFHTNSFR
jgi:hypothetical protein